MNTAEKITPVIRDVGDSALLIELGDQLDLRINRAVQVFDRLVNSEPVTGVIDTSPTLRSLLVRFNPLLISHGALREVLHERLQHLAHAEASHATRRWRVPVYYGGDNESELNDVASLLSLSVDEVIAEHCEFIQTVLTLGFAPGFLYLGLLPQHWHIPRLEQVKPRVPAGSVSVAVGQTVLTSTPIPTGWRTIGVTPFCNFYPMQANPFRIEAGDQLHFYAIDENELHKMRKAVQRGESVVEYTTMQSPTQ
ncbi:MAG: allophanate hydrolase subunit 1 [Pseudomonadota bacterium]